MSPRLATPLLALLLCAPATIARAGDPGPLQLTFVNMTPDAQSSAASRKCVRDLESLLREHGYVEITRLGETAARKRVGKTGGEPFTAWPPEALKPFSGKFDDGTYGYHAVFLVDCRPEQKQIDVAFTPAGGAEWTTVVQVRRTAIVPATLQLVKDAIDRRLYFGHEP